MWTWCAIRLKITSARLTRGFFIAMEYAHTFVSTTTYPGDLTICMFDLTTSEKLAPCEYVCQEKLCGHGGLSKLIPIYSQSGVRVLVCLNQRHRVADLIRDGDSLWFVSSPKNMTSDYAVGTTLEFRRCSCALWKETCTILPSNECSRLGIDLLAPANQVTTGPENCICKLAGLQAYVG